MLTIVWIIFEPVKKTATVTLALRRPKKEKTIPSRV